MIARLCALVLFMLAAPAAAAPAPDWTRVAAKTAEGGVQVGNPRAAVRLIEIANYTCPHCAHFSVAASAALAGHIRRGALAVEYRPIVNNGLGMAATLVARCSGAGFLRVNDALYARQDRWYAQAARYAQANQRTLAGLSRDAQLRRVAEGGGLVALAAATGVAAARVRACLTQATIDDTLRAVEAAGALAGSTPTFLIGAERVEGADWPAVLAKLRAAGLK